LLPIPSVRRGGRAGFLARLAVALGGFGIGLGALAAMAIYTAYAGELTRPEWREKLRSFDDMVAVGVTRFEASDHSLVGETFEERRLAVAWEELPRKLILAFLAVEDARFFDHTGIDLRGVARAMVVNLMAGNLREGASTITQQLAKTLVGAQKSLTRKVLEAILARRMEDRYTKEQILTWYLNVIYLGHGSYGVKAAAQNYFRKTLDGLTLAEMAALAGLPQSPGRVNPWLNPEASRRRTHHVLDKMLEQGWISSAEADAAKREPLKVYPLREPLRDQAPWYTETVRRDGAKLLGPDWLARGLNVTLGLDPATQRTAELELAEELEGVQMRQGWRGALGNLPRDTFLARNAEWAPQLLATATPGAIPVGARVLARVERVNARSADMLISNDIVATMALADASWAAPWTEQPVVAGDDGRKRRDTKAKVSFDSKLKSLDLAFSVGDIVLVEVLEPPAPPKESPPKKAPKTPKPPRKPKKDTKKRKGPEAVADTKDAAPRVLHVKPVALSEVGGALLSLHPDGTSVDAMVGGFDFDRSEVNRAQSLRQLGSLMKPVIYGLAYELSLPPSALLSGAPFRDGRYNPTGARVEDDMFVWDGLAESENSVSLRVLRYVLNRTDDEAYRAWGKALGLSRPLEGHMSEVLGMDQTLWDAFTAYATFASVGLKVTPRLVQKAVDRDGKVVLRQVHPLQVHTSTHDALIAVHQRAATPPTRMIRRSTAHILVRNLVDAIQRGTGREARSLGFPVAGKTGTLPYDVWFAGFSDRRTTLVWVGDDNRTRTLGPSERDNRIYGATAPLPVFVRFMRAVDTLPKGAARAVPGGEPPPDVYDVAIDPATGLLAHPDTPGARVLPHRAGTAPIDYAPRAQDILNVGDIEQEF
jgi:penicillin-binding protein 1A